MGTALPVVAPHEAWGAWYGDPLTLVGLLTLAAAYMRGLEILRREHPRQRPLPTWRVLAFVAAWLLLTVALISPLDALAHTLLSAHMVQHLLLMVGVPPLLIAGRTLLVSSWALPPRGRVWLHDRLRLLRRGTWRSAAVAGSVWAAHLGVLWLWHLPDMYEAALRSQLVHAVEHATMLGVAVIFWWSILRRGVLRYGISVLALTVTAAGAGALAALFTFSEKAWYSMYDPAGAGWALTAIDDQNLSGAIMWVGGGLAYTAAAATLFVWWLQALERRAARRERRARRLPVAALALPLLLLVGCERAQPPTEETAMVAQGREAIQDYGCVSCHAIDDIPRATGQVGPSLHDVAQRETLAGNLPNTPENLVLWIQSPQEVDPGNLMPDLDVTDQDAEAMARYLDALD